jgi:glycosyltransferase involved in cell wall biosynthesis
MTRSPSVLHVIDSLGLGGAQSVLKSYLEAHATDSTFRLYALRTADSQSSIAHPNVEVNPSRRRFSLMPLLALRRIVRERSIEIVHCHLFRAQVFGYLLKQLFAPDLALVFHEHGRAVGRESESYLEVLLFRAFMRLAWRRVDRFICVSEHARARLLALIPGARDRTVVVVNPVPVRPQPHETFDRETIRHAAGIPEDAFVVGFAARLVATKGWNEFLDAVALLARELPVFFLLAGDGEDRGKAAARIRELGLEGRGRLLGPIDWMNRFYRCLDCFVLPSHWEAHGLAHLEAQSFGVPVVVSSVPGLESTVHADRDALLFRARDASGLAECIRRLAADRALRERLRTAGLDNSSRYTMDAFAAGMRDVYAALPT